MLERNIERYNAEKKFIFQFDMNNLIPTLRPEFPWLNEINAQTLQGKCRDLDAALKRSFAKKQGSKSGFPKFKSKSHCSDSFRIPQGFKISSDGFKLPKIAGWIKSNKPRKLQGKAKNITIKQDGEHWIAVVLCELPDVPQREIFASTEVVGIDVGLTDFAVLSDGTKVKNPKHHNKSEARLQKRQRQLSRKKKGSCNRTKARKSVAKLHRVVRNQRKDFQQKLAFEITNRYAVVCMEALDVKQMVKNRRFSKNIGSAGWYGFKTKVGQKLYDRGGMLVEVDPRNTSKTCNSCGHIREKLELSTRKWTCTECGVVRDRDINAALNIRDRGINRVGTTRIYGCGDTSDGMGDRSPVSHVSTKQQYLDALAFGIPMQ